MFPKSLNCLEKKEVLPVPRQQTNTAEVKHFPAPADDELSNWISRVSYRKLIVTFHFKSESTRILRGALLNHSV